ncbi:hypothetical protein BKA64DRAFT_393757 [Cadophora sp. MPI-SDFR-AT-0126]|nr:hypothetical protein BKA64DRAFT_393757 [Leotiomycetes sp. MPI-SDFR-AT-0126]
MDSQYSRNSSVGAPDAAAGYSSSRSSMDGGVRIEPSASTDLTPEHSPMEPMKAPSALASARSPFRHQTPAAESDALEPLKQENAALLTRVAALESKSELQNRIILYVYEENKAFTRENHDLYCQVDYLEQCLQKASIKHENMADRLHTLECTELAQNWVLSDMRQKNHELVTEHDTVLGQIERLKEVIQMACSKEEETAKQLHLARLGFAKRFALTNKERGALRRRANQYAQDRRELAKQVEEINHKYQNAARSQSHILQALESTSEELEATKAGHTDEKERHEQTWRLMANWSNLRAKRYSDIANQLQNELNAKDLKIEEQNLTIHQHAYIIDEVCHILNNLSPELQEAIKEQNRALKEQESTSQDDKDETCSNYSDSAETIVYTPRAESADDNGFSYEQYRNTFL